MTPDKTQITLTRQQFGTLLRIFYLGKWMLESHHDDFDIKFKKEQELEQFIYAQADNDLVEFSADDGRFFPTAKWEEKMDGFIHDYDEHTFWEELAYRLADRDFTNEFGKKIEKMDAKERLGHQQKFLDKYMDEFEKNGIKNIKI